DIDKRRQQSRLKGDKVRKLLNDHHIKTAQILGMGSIPDETIGFTEGMALGNYQFLKYKNQKDAKVHSLQKILVRAEGVDAVALSSLENTVTATAWARDLVNEPLNALNAVKLAETIRHRCSEAGIHVEVLSKKKIEALKMGGLLAVNRGSVDPPSFTILEYKPDNAINTQPVVLVGKGVVYDTGGLSLKPSAGMEEMKSDMSGAAAVAAATLLTALNHLPLHLVTLIPATDNRPDGNAYVPGDVITMYDGTTVEVLNTDAEGRLILADALAYAKQLQPMLVVDLATLTGAAQRATGIHGMVGMEARASGFMKKLIQSGYHTWERIVEFPLWDEYDDMLKSDIADMKNIGGVEAGAITAGKFLQRFTDYPFIHLDIAGTAFSGENFNYHGKGGTGSGVRLLYHFLRGLAGK
ncbi:MAG: leucyl aminopeptidase, partial [Bacteroidales bacterium]|nr:leucyl aminopeptidase [Bacteroidales bacterium]